MHDGDRRRGAYGLTVESGIAPHHLVEAGPGWPEWELRWEPTAERHSTAASREIQPVVETWSLDHARLAARPEGYLTIDRHRALTTLFLREQPSADALVHPHLGSTAIIVGNWLGRIPFHGGAFIVDGRAWGVLGGREHGKSAALMWLHRFGLPVLADDLLLLDGAMALAGPRCLDLRENAAKHFDAGTYLGMIGIRERWRVELPPIAASVPFAGWIVLGWSEEIALGPNAAASRLTALASHRALKAPDANMNGVLDLLPYPMLSFKRPRTWTRMDEAMGQLLKAIDRVTQSGGQ